MQEATQQQWNNRKQATEERGWRQAEGNRKQMTSNRKHIGDSGQETHFMATFKVSKQSYHADVSGSIAMCAPPPAIKPSRSNHRELQ